MQQSNTLVSPGAAWKFWLGPVLLLLAGVLVALAIFAGPPLNKTINGVAGAVWVAAAVYLLLELRSQANGVTIFLVALAGAIVMAVGVRPSTYFLAMVGFLLIGGAVALVATTNEMKWAMLAPALYFPVHIAYSIAKVLLSHAPMQVRTDPPPTAAFVPFSMIIAAAVAGFVVSALREQRRSRSLTNRAS